MNNRVRLQLLILLLIPAVLLALMLAGAMERSPSRSPLPRSAITIDRPVSGSSGDGTVAAVPPPPLSRFTRITGRPLFTPGRRPRETGSPAAGSPPGGGGHYRVIGIVITDDETVALLKQAGSPASARRVAQGDTIDGWRVATINADRVVLKRAGATNVLKLSESRLRAGQPAARVGKARKPD